MVRRGRHRPPCTSTPSRCRRQCTRRSTCSLSSTILAASSTSTPMPSPGSHAILYFARWRCCSIHPSLPQADEFNPLRCNATSSPARLGRTPFEGILMGNTLSAVTFYACHFVACSSDCVAFAAFVPSSRQRGLCLTPPSSRDRLVAGQTPRNRKPAAPAWAQVFVDRNEPGRECPPAAGSTA